MLFPAHSHRHLIKKGLLVSNFLFLLGSSQFKTPLPQVFNDTKSLVVMSMNEGDFANARPNATLLLTAQSTPPTQDARRFYSSNCGLVMSTNSHSVCVLPDTGATANYSKRLLTKDGCPKNRANQAFPAAAKSSEVPRRRRNGNRIGINQRMRILQKYVAGKTKADIAKEEGIHRESVRRIVRSPDLTAYVEEKREMWRGLCDPAIEVLRQKLKEGDKEVALRVLESNGVIPFRATFNHKIHTTTKPTGDERVKTLIEAFAAVAIQRAKVFRTPFPELAEVAEQHNISLDFELDGASDEAEEI